MLAVLTVTACTVTAENTHTRPPAATITATLSVPASDPNGRSACRQIAATDYTDLHPDLYIAIADTGMKSTSQQLRDAAGSLSAAAGSAAQAGPDGARGPINGELVRTRLAFAEACADQFGDGPW